ncbi:hypothetical protein CLV96_2048 [Leptospira meyeri]|uniref:Lipoprotein n=1 Tax=Leptospira meyeri TaxID=29508 RepID=A0A4R8MU19_LEPME|nr:hypothetical protein [Leptospira meyeri]EKJ87101.1 hypothetical protein LEP1GSC017_1956 [Leptospira meyeri serovar Hardjo str. Went 5]TDY73029.1 hypothetical protein CLV96_2048 [Leptospira meyeri]TGL51112.1 hypothetical protein EHQ55_06010 [Leptospira meyeri]
MKFFDLGIFALLFSIGTNFQCIQNRDDLFYSPQEGNQKIFESYALKNSSCGANKLPGALVLGRVKIDELKLCFKAIELTDCNTWNTEGYLPDSCKAISTSFR